MRRRVELLLRDPRVQRAGDMLLALVLAATSVAAVLIGDPSSGPLIGDPSWGRPEPLGVALALLSTVPVAWRTRRPLLAAAIVLAANGACIFAAAPHEAAFQPSHVASILAKLGLRDRVQAVVYAYESGLVRPGTA